MAIGQGWIAQTGTHRCGSRGDLAFGSDLEPFTSRKILEMLRIFVAKSNGLLIEYPSQSLAFSTPNLIAQRTYHSIQVDNKKLCTHETAFAGIAYDL